MKIKFNNLSTVFIIGTVMTLIFISIAFTIVGYELIESLGNFAISIDEDNNKRISKDLFLELTSRIEYSYSYHFEKIGNTTEVLAHFIHNEIIDKEKYKTPPEIKIKLKEYLNRNFYIFSNKKDGQFYYWGPKDKLPYIEWQINLYSQVTDIIRKLYHNNPSWNSIWFHSINEYIYGYPQIEEYYTNVSSAEVYKNYYKNMIKEAPKYSFENSYKYILEMPYTDLSGNTVLTFKSPVYDDTHDFVGYLGVDVDLAIIRNDLMYEKLFNNSTSTKKAILKGFTYILGPSGEIITFPENYSELFNIPQQQKVPGNKYKNKYFKLEDSSDPEVKKLAQKIKNSELGITEAELDGKMYTCSYARIKKTDWSLGFVVESDSLLRSAISTRKQLAITKTGMLKSSVTIFVIFLILSLLLLFLVFRKFLLKPLVLLRNAIKDLGKGDFNAKVRLKSVSEINDLVESFNYLGNKLQKYMTDLKDETQKKQMIKTEIEIAGKLQNSVLPKITSEFIRKEFDIYAKLVPATDMSGDFYDFFYVRKNILAIIVADVSGKGIEAAFYMSMAKAILKEACLTAEALDTGKICEKFNDILVNSVQKPMYLTMYLMFYNIETGKITYTNAAHNNFLKITKDGNIFSLGTENSNVFIGGLENGIKYNSNETYLAQGEKILLYTDGITEANYQNGDFFGEDNLIKIIKECYQNNLESIVDTIISKVIEYQHGKKFDDITCIIFERNF